jgi:hypothetical protein
MTCTRRISYLCVKDELDRIASIEPQRLDNPLRVGSKVGDNIVPWFGELKPIADRSQNERLVVRHHNVRNLGKIVVCIADEK